MTDSVAVAIVGIIVPTLTVIIAAVNERSKRKGEAARLEGKVDVVHKLSNNRLTKALKESRLANAKIDRLEQLLLEFKQKPAKGKKP